METANRASRCLAAPAVAVALLAAGCGGDSSDTDTSTPQGMVKQTILDWTFEQDKCLYMTDKFIEEQAFTGGNRDERCKYLRDSAIAPRYSKDDVKFRKVDIAGTTATVVVGSDIASIEVTYKLVKPGDRWLIDEGNL